MIITDAQIQAEVEAVMAKNHWTGGLDQCFLSTRRKEKGLL